MSILSRRNFLTGLIAAPVIIRASSLMPVKVFDGPIIWGIDHGLKDVFTVDMVARCREMFLRKNEFVRALNRVTGIDSIVYARLPLDYQVQTS